MSRRVLVTRFGGIGDVMPLTVVCRELKARGLADHITFATREPIIGCIEHNPYIDATVPLRRINGADCRPTTHGWTDWHTTIPQYAAVYDYVNTVENNPFADHGNWYDLALAFAKMDPNSVADKTPVYVATEAEREAARAQYAAWGWQDGPVGVVMLGGSSRLRQYDRWAEVVEQIHAADPATRILCLGEDKHRALAPPETEWCKTLVETNGAPSLRESAALLAEAQWGVGTDSGFLHLAEALAVPFVGLFTTVRAWTRSQYYRYVVSLDETSGCPSAPCCSLDTWCPVDVQRMTADPAQWTSKHAVLWERAFRAGAHPDTLAPISGMHPNQFGQEWNYMVQRHQTYPGTIPACVRSHTPAQIVAAVRALPQEVPCV